MQRCFRRGLPARLLLLAEFAIEARKGDLTLSLELEPSFAKELEPSFAVSTTVSRYSFVCSSNKHLFFARVPRDFPTIFRRLRSCLQVMST